MKSGETRKWEDKFGSLKKQTFNKKGEKERFCKKFHSSHGGPCSDSICAANAMKKLIITLKLVKALIQSVTTIYIWDI